MSEIQKIQTVPLSQVQKKHFSNICSLRSIHVHFDKVSHMTEPKLGAEWEWAQEYHLPFS